MAEESRTNANGADGPRLDGLLTLWRRTIGLVPPQVVSGSALAGLLIGGVPGFVSQIVLSNYHLAMRILLGLLLGSGAALAIWLFGLTVCLVLMVLTYGLALLVGTVYCLLTSVLFRAAAFVKSPFQLVASVAWFTVAAGLLYPYVVLQWPWPWERQLHLGDQTMAINLLHDLGLSLESFGGFFFVASPLTILLQLPHLFVVLGLFAGLLNTGHGKMYRDPRYMQERTFKFVPWAERLWAWLTAGQAYVEGQDLIIRAIVPALGMACVAGFLFVVLYTFAMFCLVAALFASMILAQLIAWKATTLAAIFVTGLWLHGNLVFLCFFMIGAAGHLLTLVSYVLFQGLLQVYPLMLEICPDLRLAFIASAVVVASVMVLAINVSRWVLGRALRPA
jgi:hypothetical protein